MLKLCQKGCFENSVPLSAEDDQALRAAYGRFADPAARAKGAAVVQQHQHRENGHWFLCDCLSEGERPPVLVPVLESYIRRHTDPPWPRHTIGCDFYREPEEQRLISRSFARPPGQGFRLIRGFADFDDNVPPGPPVQRCYATRRDALATLLMTLVEEAGINVIGNQAPDLSDQYRGLRSAAADVELDEGVSLADFLCTYPPALPRLFGKIASTPYATFKHARPHGVFVTVVHGIAEGRLALPGHENLPVRCRISIFGERDGNAPSTPINDIARAPYLVACLIGRAKADGPVEALRAYAHPCVSFRHLMPVDSNFERGTLDELLRLKGWLGEKKGIALSISKPLFDLFDAVQSDPNAPPRPPCIPDFILRADNAPGIELLLVETMGFADEVYRRRKASIHHVMSSISGAPVVQHDFHFPGHLTQHQRDRGFWLNARWLITGPGSD